MTAFSSRPKFTRACRQWGHTTLATSWTAGQEVARGLLIAGGDRTELFDPGEEVLDQMALAVKRSVIIAQRGPVGPRRDHRRLAGRNQGLKDALVGVVCLVGDQRIGRHRGQEVVCSHQVVRFAAGQEEAERIAERIDQCMDLGAQSAPRAPDCLVLTGFFLAPALC